MDTIGDFLTIIRNASVAERKNCIAQWSKIREGVVKNLRDEGFVSAYEIYQDERGFKFLKITLKYHKGDPAITNIKRNSRPGCRKYLGYQEIPRVLGGMGISILSTSKGIKTDRTARNEKIGGELLCTVY